MRRNSVGGERREEGALEATQKALKDSRRSPGAEVNINNSGVAALVSLLPPVIRLALPWHCRQRRTISWTQKKTSGCSRMAARGNPPLRTHARRSTLAWIDEAPRSPSI